MGVGGQHHAPAALPPVKTRCPIVQEAGWAPGPVWTGAENLAPTGIRSPDRPAHSESLYRLSYPGPFIIIQDAAYFISCHCSSFRFTVSYRNSANVVGTVLINKAREVMITRFHVVPGVIVQHLSDYL